MSPMTAELVALLEAERLRPTPPPPREYPDGPSAHWRELLPPPCPDQGVGDAGR
ncbi:hypothetical protein GCM10023224_05350 [Streptomonospora halophila]|uniref:Uncharacterized protein n=1 Tax=Streptomonospora halophila TaxID=427369 RepID=A0ABP9G5Z1_9ACTN